MNEQERLTLDHSWTAAKVRELLPDVKIKCGRKHYTGRIYGRLNKFATITIWFEDRPYQDFTYSWDTIAHALNTGKPLLT